MKKEVKIKNILASLYELSQMVKSKSIGLSKEMEKTRILLLRIFEFNLFSIFQYDYLERRLLPVYMYGDPFNLVDAVNFRLGKGATGWCLSHKKSLLICNLGREKNYERFFVKSFLAVPIIFNAENIGVIVMGSFKVNQYDISDRFLLELSAPLIGNIILKERFNLQKNNEIEEEK